ncbi:MAG: SDR family NAD(P)-dependent oxidoreductase [Pseudomonadales bacterium]|nr:SDR family NAD(P)-dependent oxidoreductase [Pseudomonadales bacterium]
MQLKGRIAAITGGTRGIGRGIAEAFIAEGAKVVIGGRSEAKGKRALEEMNAGDNAEFMTLDAQNQAEIEAFVDGTIERFGQVDILVNNAGGSSGFAPIATMTDEAWASSLDMMLNATFWSSRRALPGMLERGWGRIINITSVDSKLIDKANIGHYIVNKSAINTLTKVLAFENGPGGVTTNAILPGAVETDLMNVTGRKIADSMNVSYEDYLNSYAEVASTKRLTTVEEIAAVAVLLASEHGGGINGSELDVHGGTSL